MIQAKQVMEILASQLNLTKPSDEIETYILTSEEEDQCISHAIKSAKELFKYKRLQIGDPLESINMKMAEKNWEDSIDKVELFRSANSKKHYEMWLKKKRDDEKKQEEGKKRMMVSRYTARFVFNIMSWTAKNVYGKDLKVTENNKRLISAICFFISNDIRFEKELGFSFKKGLMIRGVSGLGKTFLMSCVKDNEINPINMMSMIDISEAVQHNGNFDLPTDKTIYLDDVGTEQHVVNHFGTKVNWFKNFIEKYYLKNLPFNKLIISTNINFDGIEERYGFRVRSRMKDMFNVIDVEGEDMRG